MSQNMKSKQQVDEVVKLDHRTMFINFQTLGCSEKNQQSYLYQRYNWYF